MMLDSTQTLDDLRGEGSFSVGGVKNQRFLVTAKKNRRCVPGRGAWSAFITAAMAVTPHGTCCGQFFSVLKARVIII